MDKLPVTCKSPCTSKVELLPLITTLLPNVVLLPLDTDTPKLSNWIEEDIIPEGVLFTSLYWIWEFSQTPALYFKYSPVTGPVISTSVISPKLLIVEVPPPDEPAVFLNKPALIMLAKDSSDKSVVFAWTTK